VQYIPERYHLKGKLAGQLIVDDVKWTAAIFAKEKPFEFNAWVENQKRLNKLRIGPTKFEEVDIDTDFLAKIESINKTIYKKGKCGKIISQ
jgi:hypothetical protein